MALTDEEERTIRELAEIEGRSVEDVKREMLRARLGLSGSGAPAVPTQALTRTAGFGDASGASLARSRAEAIQQHQSQEFPGSPVVRYRGNEEESPAQAEERWLAEEAELLDGVHGLGGQTAGGIFGDGAIATSIYDPSAMGRADARVGQMANIKLLGLVERLEQRLGPADPPAGQLPPGQRGALPPGTGRRRLPR